MILQELNDYYYRLLEDPESGVAPPGYSRVDISFVLVLSEQGNLLDMYQAEISNLVPEHKKRQGTNPPPYFLCDKILYSLGISKDKGEGKNRFEQYRDYNLILLRKSESTEAKSVSTFLETWEPEKWDSNEIIMRYKESYDKPTNLNVVYRIDGYEGFVHENNEIATIWLEEQSEKDNKDAVMAQCLVSGKQEIIARTHEVAIKGAGGQPAGTALVSFQIESFRSYNKTQSYNAPVSKKAAFAYGTALNYLIASNINRVLLADTTMVFWADKKGGRKTEAMLSWLIDPIEDINEGKDNNKEGKRKIDFTTALQAKNVLERVKSGLPVGDTTFSGDTRCYLLGLAPNAARLSVRFWQVSSFGDVINKIAQHYSDIEIEGLKHNTPPWKILKAVAVQGDSKNIPPLLGGQLIRAILTGQVYPQTLYNAVLMRCRSGGEYNGVSPLRAAIVKAILKRRYRIMKLFEKEALITVGLNETNSNVAYLLGRLFSLLEKVQRDALGKDINATIKDRYFGAASATPGAIFPLLLRLSRHHISKSEYGTLMDKKIQNVLNQIETFPTHFNLEEQGQFILGYYHQNQANYTKNN